MPTMWFGFVGSTARSLSLRSFAVVDQRCAHTLGSRFHGALPGHASVIGVVDAWMFAMPALLAAYPPAAPPAAVVVTNTPDENAKATTMRMRGSISPPPSPSPTLGG